jgi:hypothetical protein
MALNEILSGALRGIVGAEGAGQYLVHHLPLCVQPDDGDGEKDEEHVDGGQADTLPGLGEDEGFILPNGPAKHQAPAFGEKGVTPLDLGGDNLAGGEVPDHYPMTDNREVSIRCLFGPSVLISESPLPVGTPGDVHRPGFHCRAQ